jgi:hypothetical protein
MVELLDRYMFAGARVGCDERIARAELRRQIGRLELELGRLGAEAFRRVEVEGRVRATGRQPRLIGLGELERVRDALAARVADARRTLDKRAETEAANRLLLERMLASPADYKWLRISRADLGEPGCGH